jgi:ribosome-associated protein
MSLVVRPGLEIPDSDIDMVAIRSAGPGGQNVNKVASAVQLRFALHRNVTLREDVKARLRALAGQRLNDADEILIVARAHRSQ